MDIGRYIPFRDLRGYRRADATHDLIAGVGVAFLSVPQGVAYAMIAGLPPAMGLYAAAVPAIVGGLFRSSRHVVTGPSNAVSLLVGTAIATAGGADPVQAAITLALMVGLLQVAAGVLGLGVLVDYISRPVVLGYITGAGVLILVGQLPNMTATEGESGNAFARIAAWAADLGGTEPAAVGLALGTAALVLVLRRVDARIPGAIVAMGIGIGLGYALDVRALGIPVVADLTPIPTGLPPLTAPDLGQAGALFSGAVACTVLSLVESTSVARSVAEQTGQRIHRSVELTGQGLSNLAAALTGGYPTSGSVGRTALSLQLGARTRLAGVSSGAVVLLVLLFLGPIVDHTPVPTLAGLLLVIAMDLVDRHAIGRVLRSYSVDRLAFLGTVLGTFLLPLDQAIYLGVVISLVLFLRRARMLVVQELVVGDDGRLREVDPESERAEKRRCHAIRIFQLEGALFFGAAGELRAALDQATESPEVRALVLRTKRTVAMDITTAGVLEATARRLEERGGRLLLVGMKENDVRLLERTGTAARIGRENLFPTEPGWFVAMERALRRAKELAGDHTCGDSCPIAEWHR